MDDLCLMFENMPVRLVASRNIPRVETAGIFIEETEAGKELIVSQSEGQNLQSMLEEVRTDRDALKIEITNLEEKLRAQQMEIILLGDENRVVQSTLEAKVALISSLQKQLSEIDYHCRLYNWDSDDPTNTPLDKAYDLLPGRTLVGGVDRNGWLLHSTPQEISNQMKRLTAAHDPSRVIIGPGCSVPPEVPMENFKAVRENLS